MDSYQQGVHPINETRNIKHKYSLKNRCLKIYIKILTDLPAMCHVDENVGGCLNLSLRRFMSFMETQFLADGADSCIMLRMRP